MTTEKVPRVGVFGWYIPHYRWGVFSLLHRLPMLDFTFLADTGAKGSFLRTDEVDCFRYRQIQWRHVRVPGTRANTFNFLPYTLTAFFRREYDVFILSNDILGIDIWICALLARLMGRKVCLWGQGISRPTSRLRETLRKALMTLAHAVIFYSEGGRDFWLRRGMPPEKLFVAYNALDTDQQLAMAEHIGVEELRAFRQAHGLERKKLITFTGRLIADKKPQIFVQALREVVADTPEAHGVIIGDGPLRGELESMIRQLGMESHITLTGALYDEETIAKFYLCSHAAVMPAYAGLAIQHAFAYGVPIIIGDLPHSHGPEAELVEEGVTGLYCPDEDVPAFAQAIRRLLRDDALHATLSRNARETIFARHNKQMMALGIVNAARYCLGHPPLTVEAMTPAEEPKIDLATV